MHCVLKWDKHYFMKAVFLGRLLSTYLYRIQLNFYGSMHQPNMDVMFLRKSFLIHLCMKIELWLDYIVGSTCQSE